MSRVPRIELERLRHWHGQELMSRDFRDQAEIEAQLRWWHNRALHNTYGVRHGYSVLPVIVNERFVAVHVGPGLAYDRFGRALILQQPLEVPIPTSGLAMLLIRYRETAQFFDERDMTACRASGHTTVLEQPDVFWKPIDQVGTADGVPLARLSYEPAARLETLPAGIQFPKSLADRIRYDPERKRLIFKGPLTEDEKQELLQLSPEMPYREAVVQIARGSERAAILDAGAKRARPFARPRIGSGATAPKDTAWETWTETVMRLDRTGSFSELPVGLQVTVDTSAAGFTETPCYFAWLQGTLWKQSNIEFIPVPLTHIDLASVNGFRFRLWMSKLPMLLDRRARVANQSFDKEFINFAREQKLYVCWTGVQPVEAEADVFDCTTDMAPECRTQQED